MQNLTDRALKERIIGAAVLVLVAVLIVPIFLDGAADNQPVISTSVVLPGQDGEERRQQTIVLNRNRSEPVPASRARPGGGQNTIDKEVAEPEPVIVEAQQPAPPPTTGEGATDESVSAAVAPVKPEAASPVQSETGMWAVQLGSFSSQENAETLAADLRGQGYAAFLSQLRKGDVALHRVRVGPQKDRESATTIAVQLGKSGHTGQVVPHP